MDIMTVLGRNGILRMKHRRLFSFKISLLGRSTLYKLRLTIIRVLEFSAKVTTMLLSDFAIELSIPAVPELQPLIPVVPQPKRAYNTEMFSFILVTNWGPID